jgi:hypothetical protein
MLGKGGWELPLSKGATACRWHATVPFFLKNWFLCE